LLGEIEWLKELQKYILNESKSRQGKPSGYHLEKLNEDYLNPIIKNLEREKPKYANSQ
jgi:hypothetical protein